MLDGLVIKGNELAAISSNPVESDNSKKKNDYTSVAISAFVHILLASLLFFIAEKEQIKPDKITNNAIKSYLYQMPPKKVESKPVAQELPIQKHQAPTNHIPVKNAENVSTQNTKATTTPKAMQDLTVKDQVKVTVKPNVNTSLPKGFSAYKQLDNLRANLKNKAISQELSQLQQFRSPSVMHGEPIPVPASMVQLTQDQERSQNTTKMSNNISIIKHDNGVCTIEREQFLGSPVEGSSAFFACGEAKFDKNFREHMNKVKNKIIPKR